MDGLIYLPPVAASYYLEYGFEEMVKRPNNTTNQMSNVHNPAIAHNWGTCTIVNSVHAFGPHDILNVKLKVGQIEVTTAVLSSARLEHPTSRIMVDTDPTLPESVMEALTGSDLGVLFSGLPAFLQRAFHGEIIENVMRLGGRLQLTTVHTPIQHATQLKVRCNALALNNLDPISLIDDIELRHSDSEMSYA